MKQGRLFINVTMILIAAVIAVYFTVYIFNAFQEPYTTTPAYLYTANDSVEASGVLVREEVVLPEQNGIVDLIRGEGEKVGVGQRLALVYRDTQAQSDQAELEALELEIELLEYAASESGDTQSAARLDETILQSVVELRASAALNNFSLLEEQVVNVKSSVLKRGYTYGDGLTSAGLNARLQSLQSRRAEVEGRTFTSTSAVRAPRSGTFSSLVDGYEERLTPENVFSLTPSSLKEILNGPGGGPSGIGKLVTSNCWYFAATLPEEAAQRLKENSHVKMRFTGDFSQDVDMKVEKIGAKEGDERFVVFSSDRYLGRTTLLRIQTAELIFDSWSGLRVPKNALRLVKSTYTDKETGQELEQNRLGVYVLIGGRVEFKEAEVAMEGGDYYVLRPADASSHALRAGDIILVDGTGLYDGQRLEF